jgi:hypothetical protein
MGRSARTAANFWVFLTPGNDGLLCLVTAGLRGAALRVIGFLGVRTFFASFFDAAFLLFSGFDLALFFAIAL